MFVLRISSQESVVPLQVHITYLCIRATPLSLPLTSQDEKFLSSCIVPSGSSPDQAKQRFHTRSSTRSELFCVLHCMRSP